MIPIQLGTGLLYPALRKAGITLGPGRTPSPAQFQDAIEECNRLLGNLNCDPYWIYSQDILTFPLTGKTSYTIGIDPAGALPPADWAVQAPQAITFANYLTGSPPVRSPVDVLTPQVWASIPVVQMNWLSAIYYDRHYPIANIYLYGPTSSGSLELFTWHQVSVAQGLTDVVVLPPGYDDAIVLNLACRLAPHFQLAVSPDVQLQARESLMRVLSLNAPKPLLDYGWGSCGCEAGTLPITTPPAPPAAVFQSSAFK